MSVVARATHLLPRFVVDGKSTPLRGCFWFSWTYPLCRIGHDMSEWYTLGIRKTNQRTMADGYKKAFNDTVRSGIENLEMECKIAEEAVESIRRHGNESDDYWVSRHAIAAGKYEALRSMVKKIEEIKELAD